MKIVSLIILISSLLMYPLSGSSRSYELSFKISGDAKGTILLIFPYRIYYSANASLLFNAHLEKQGSVLFRLSAVNTTGSMMRTLGFSGRSVGILTADNNKVKAEKRAEYLKRKFLSEAPEYSKYIKKYFWNNFRFGKIKDSITFSRSRDGIHENLKNDLWLTKTGGEHPLRINFNIYRILGEIIKSYNNSFLPDGKDISEIIASGTMEWQSGEIDFSDILAKSALFAAKIFKKIDPLKQEKPFRAVYRSTISPDTRFLIIKGKAGPDISIWGSFKIRRFAREVKIRIQDHVLMSDNMVVSVYNNSGKGGRLTTSLTLKEQK